MKDRVRPGNGNGPGLGDVAARKETLTAVVTCSSGATIRRFVKRRGMGANAPVWPSHSKTLISQALGEVTVINDESG